MVILHHIQRIRQIACSLSDRLDWTTSDIKNLTEEHRSENMKKRYHYMSKNGTKQYRPIPVLFIIVAFLILFFLFPIPFMILLFVSAGWSANKSKRQGGSAQTGLLSLVHKFIATKPEADPAAAPPQAVVDGYQLGRASDSSKPVVPEYDYFKTNHPSVEHYWNIAFHDNLEKFTQGSNIDTSKHYGLIYHFIIDGQIRYIGQIRSNTLRWHMTRQRNGNYIGYNDLIKRSLLNAAGRHKLKISTIKVSKVQLEQYEKSEIEAYAPTNKLWNQEHNPHFKTDNFYQ